ncbi:hypothetical protein PIB30_000700 [Stylosanthes scabra]|uniref:Uncharacterized protein n=1 Tax=Stylosanthes scabra TaxID=79078 RepID=A0ABU6Z0E5_9FABA|nr:hypothetical protein [Stylosanthes scabra]
MAQDMFHFIVYVNGAIIQGENMAFFQSNAPLMFRNTRVNTLYELKQEDYARQVDEFLVEVRHVGGSSGFRPYQLPAVPTPINIVPPNYNPDDDSDYDDESSGHSTDDDEMVLNTPAGGPRLVLPAPKPIPALTDVPSFF